MVLCGGAGDVLVVQTGVDAAVLGEDAVVAVQTAPTQVLRVEQERHGHVALQGRRGEVGLDPGEFGGEDLLDLVEVELQGLFGAALRSVLRQVLLQDLLQLALLRLSVL